MKAINPIAAWHDEHVYFGRLLKLLGKELDVFHGGERPNYELMLDIVGYLRDYGDQYHHPREDEAYARLARRRITAALQSDIAPRAALPISSTTATTSPGRRRTCCRTPRPSSAPRTGRR